MSRKRGRSASLLSEDGVKESLPNLSSTESSPPVKVEHTSVSHHRHHISTLVQIYAKTLTRLFKPSNEAKIWGIASKALHQSSAPKYFPEYTHPSGTSYVYRESDFWTSGFFPGSLYLLLERRRKFKTYESITAARNENLHDLHLEYACKLWTENLHKNAHLRTTHDLGFMIMPWARTAYEINHDLRALETIRTAAQSLHLRFDSKVGCMRSWDTCVTKKYNFQSPDSEFLVIIDNMMNLDLLFYAAIKTHNSDMYTAAIAHARTTSRTHIRPDGSTTHLVVFDPQTGEIRQRLTNQGYSHTSCWARGQAWAIAGFAETYLWTSQTEFLDTARRCADYLIDHVRRSGCVPWDFDAPELESVPQPSDSSAAVIAAYGMLLIHQALVRIDQNSQYLLAALELIHIVCTKHVNEEAVFQTTEQSIETLEYGVIKESILRVDMGGSETILNGATINNYKFAPRRWANHGLVYADYYFLLLGNKMLEMGILPPSMLA